MTDIINIFNLKKFGYYKQKWETAYNLKVRLNMKNYEKNKKVIKTVVV